MKKPVPFSPFRIEEKNPLHIDLHLLLTAAEVDTDRIVAPSYTQEELARGLPTEEEQLRRFTLRAQRAEFDTDDGDRALYILPWRKDLPTFLAFVEQLRALPGFGESEDVVHVLWFQGMETYLEIDRTVRSLGKLEGELTTGGIIETTWAHLFVFGDKRTIPIPQLGRLLRTRLEGQRTLLPSDRRSRFDLTRTPSMS